jgi:hypothetical protein
VAAALGALRDDQIDAGVAMRDRSGRRVRRARRPGSFPARARSTSQAGGLPSADARSAIRCSKATSISGAIDLGSIASTRRPSPPSGVPSDANGIAGTP